VIVSTATFSGSVGARIAERLARSLGPQRFSLWFDHTARIEYDETALQLDVFVATPFAATGIRRRYESDLRTAAKEETGREVQVDVRVEPTRFQCAVPTDHKAAMRPAPARTASNQSVHRFRHRLEDFVVGTSNELAFAAGTQIAEEDTAVSGHPLFFYGECGVGKTHLLQGICRRRLEREPGCRVRYTTGEQFTNEYIHALRERRIDGFRRSIRQLDLLAVDDVHFLGPREKTQAEFLHCFDQIDLAGARVVLASDSHPKGLEQFSKPLISRCVRGLVVQIRPPDPETRIKLLRLLADRRGMTLLPSAIERLSQQSVGSVRDIEGLLTRLHAMAMLSGDSGDTPPMAPVGHVLVDSLLAMEQNELDYRPVRFEQVIDAVIRQLGVNRSQIAGRGRNKHIVLARSLVAYLARTMTTMSFPEIAAAMQRRNHSTVVTASQRMERQIKQDKPVLIPGEAAQLTPRQLVARLRQAIKAAG
jgi:chromosomal replication initiator protein